MGPAVNNENVSYVIGKLKACSMSFLGHFDKLSEEGKNILGRDYMKAIGYMDRDFIRQAADKFCEEDRKLSQNLVAVAYEIKKMANALQRENTRFISSNFHEIIPQKTNDEMFDLMEKIMDPIDFDIYSRLALFMLGRNPTGNLSAITVRLMFWVKEIKSGRKVYDDFVQCIEKRRKVNENERNDRRYEGVSQN